MSKKTFTLVELLLVCAVLAVLAALLPGLHADDAGRSAGCADNLRKIGENVLLYASDYDNFVPGLYQSPQNTANGQRWLFTMVKYSKDLRLFSCPDSPAFKKYAKAIETCNPANADRAPDLYTVNSAGSIGVNGVFGVPANSFAFETSRQVNLIKNVDKVGYAADVIGCDTQIPEYAKGNSTGLYFGPKLAPAHASINPVHDGKANALILDGSVKILSQADLSAFIGEVSKSNSAGNNFFFVKK